MDLQRPSTSTILLRRGAPRPILKRNDSSFTAAISPAGTNDGIDISKALDIVSRNPSQKDVIKEDLKLVTLLKREDIQDTPNAEPIVTVVTPNRYESWKCGFGSISTPQTPSDIPTKPKDFLDVVQGELRTIDSIQAGLTKYLDVISSGEHQVFSKEFLDTQSTATGTMLSQLEQIKEHLNEIVREVEAKIERNIDYKDGDDEGCVRIDLQEAFGHARPWIAKTRAVMVSSHVFYKINYALAADSKGLR